jgi:DNA-binding transcriptional LysR family regulator
MYVSPPTMSRQIRTLEEKLQVTLFTRDHNTVQLTDIGQELYPELKALHDNYQLGTEHIREIVDRRQFRLRIGVLDSVKLPASFRETMVKLKRQFPKAKIQICHLPLRSAFKSLRDGTIDVLFSLDSVTPKGEMVDSFPYHRDCICLAVPADHPNAGLTEISNDEIRTYFGDLNFVLIDADEFEEPVREQQKSTTPQYADDYLDMVSGPFAELDALMLMVQTGLGITCVNRASILEDCQTVRLIPLVDRTDQGSVEHTVYVDPYWMKNNENGMLRCLLAHLRDAEAPEGSARKSM